MQKSRNLHQDFITQKNNARMRGIEFLLTYDEWLKEWQDSGVLELRGRGRNQYCMARFGDKGPYAVGNVKIILHGDNVSEAQLGNGYNVGKKLPDEHRQKIAEKSRGRKHTEEAKEKIRSKMIGRCVSPETREKIGALRRGTKRSEEANRKTSETLRKAHSERPIWGKTTKGRKQSKEERNKRSIAIKAWHQARKLEAKK